MRTVRICPGSHRKGSVTNKSWCAPRARIYTPHLLRHPCKAVSGRCLDADCTA